VMMICLAVTAAATRAGAISVEEQVEQCLKSGACAFVIAEPASTDPRLTFLVLEKTWKKFRETDKAELRQILKKKVKEARMNPDKFSSVSKKSPAYDAVIRNLKNMRSYAVFVCYNKDREGRLLPAKEVLTNY
jgi:hypothetical protein